MSTKATNATKYSTPLSKNQHLLRWVEKMAAMTRPDTIHWVDGSQEEYDELCAQLVASGTFRKLNEKLWPGCYYEMCIRDRPAGGGWSGGNRIPLDGAEEGDAWGVSEGGVEDQNPTTPPSAQKTGGRVGHPAITCWGEDGVVEIESHWTARKRELSLIHI